MTFGYTYFSFMDLFADSSIHRHAFRNPNFYHSKMTFVLSGRLVTWSRSFLIGNMICPPKTVRLKRFWFLGCSSKFRLCIVTGWTDWQKTEFSLKKKRKTPHIHLLTLIFRLQPVAHGRISSARTVRPRFPNEFVRLLHTGCLLGNPSSVNTSLI